jgi:hypothetical protein
MTTALLWTACFVLVALVVLAVAVRGGAPAAAQYAARAASESAGRLRSFRAGAAFFAVFEAACTGPLRRGLLTFPRNACTMEPPILYLDPEVKPPDFRVPRGRSGAGAHSARETLLSDLERIRQAKEAYAQLFQHIEQAVLRH